MVKGPVKWVLFAASAVLILLGILFIIASYANTLRLVEGVIFIGVAILIAYFARERKPLEIKKTVSLTGPVKVKGIRCPNCNALMDPDNIQVIDGKPYLECEYCGNKFELTEEPTW
jgi:DNA-directed RNA polymerase subunit RPC12/RpoP